MPPIKFARVVVYSSEDPFFPAKNLLTGKGKWRGKGGGSKQEYVVLELEKPTEIQFLDIGNNGSAFIEVQVGRFGMAEDSYKTLLPASSFMGPDEARVNSNTGRVRMFQRDAMNPAIAKEKWNLVKIVCTQPFSKHYQYGCALITVSGPSVPEKPSSSSASSSLDEKNSQPKKLGAFKLKEEEDSDGMAAGSYFAKYVAKKNSSKDEEGESSSSGLNLKTDQSLAEAALARSEKSEEKRRDELKRKIRDFGPEEPSKKRRTDESLPRRNALPGESPERQSDTEDDDDSTDRKGKIREEKKKKKEKHEERSREKKPKKEAKERDGQPRLRDSPSAPSRDSPATPRPRQPSRDSPATSRPGPPSIDTREKKYAPFNKLMDGIVFAISGFQNPLRGEIRQKALDMGAKYRGDWDSTCTHLVCAFANTPKFNQVKGKGKIVKKEWIESSFTQRKRLSWTKYALHRSVGDESDEEVFELVSRPSPDPVISESNANDDLPSTSRVVDEDEMDTDDEIERIQKEQEKKKLEKEKGKKKLEKEKEKNQEKDKDKKKVTPVKESKDRKRSEPKENGSASKNGVKKVDPYDAETSEEETDRKPSTKVRTPKKKLMEDLFDADTDDENDKPASSSSKANPKLDWEDLDSDEAYNAETDIDDEENRHPNVGSAPADHRLNTGEPLPAVFAGKSFLLRGFSNEKEELLLQRYVIGYGGKVRQYNGPQVDFIVMAKDEKLSKEDKRNARSGNPNVEFVKPKWIFACCDRLEIVSTSGHKIHSSDS